MLVSFRSKLIILFLGLLAFAQLGTAIAVLTSVKDDNYKQGVQSIRVARNIFDFFLAERADQLTKSVKILASDFAFKKAIATQETKTILSVLSNHGARIGTDVSLLLSPSGEMEAATKNIHIEHSLSRKVMAARRLGRTSVTTLIVLNNNAYQLVLVPVKAPNTIAWVGMAFLMDKALAEQMKRVTGLDVSFVGEAKKSTKNSIFSTLPEPAKRSFFQHFTDMQRLANKPIFNESQTYLSLSVPIYGTTQWGVLHLPYQPWLASYDKARNQLLIIFAVALLLALLLGVILARSLTSPIGRLMKFARQIGRGERHATVPIFSDEFGLLSKTMSSMQCSIQEREDEAVYKALHCPLTGFYNRDAGVQYLKGILPRKYGSVMLLKMQHMRDINSMFGYDAGDCLVVESARRIEAWSKENKAVFLSYESDYFLMVFDYNITPQECVSLHACFKEKIAVTDASEIQLSVAIGVLHFEHSDPNVSGTVRRVEIAQVFSERLSELYYFYQPGEDAQHQRRLTIVQDLPDALLDGQLFMVYQPKVGLEHHDCQEVEALIRWHHPVVGFIAPDEFIRVLEKAGSIQRLTFWVIEKVLTQLTIWRELGCHIRVAINLSALDLVDEQLPVWVNEVLQSKGLPADVIAFEVTESAVMADRKRVISVLNALQTQHIHLAIDDFGSGQSSLAYLRDLPVNEVKIDRAFIQHIEVSQHDKYIVQASIELSHSLGFEVTAEGAENQASVAILESLNCDKVQGYYFSKPLPANELFEWIQGFNDKNRLT